MDMVVDLKDSLMGYTSNFNVDFTITTTSSWWLNERNFSSNTCNHPNIG